MLGQAALLSILRGDIQTEEHTWVITEFPVHTWFLRNKTADPMHVESPVRPLSQFVQAAATKILQTLTSPSSGGWTAGAQGQQTRRLDRVPSRGAGAVSPPRPPCALENGRNPIQEAALSGPGHPPGPRVLRPAPQGLGCQRVWGMPTYGPGPHRHWEELCAWFSFTGWPLLG